MAKRKVRRSSARGAGPQPTSSGGMMRQIQELQEELVRTQESLGDETVEVSAGGGVLRVVMTGHQRVQSVIIDPEIIDPEDVEMLQDLIVAAINEAIEQSKKLAADRMGSLTGGLNLPGLF